MKNKSHLFSSSYFYTLLLYISCYFIVTPKAISQESWAPFYSNISTENYNLSTSNIDIQLDKNGVVFVGNFSGLLVYDGLNSHVLKIANGSVVNSLCIGPENQIYFASNNDFGFLNSDENGNLGYQLIETGITSRIRSTASLHDSIFVLSSNELIIYANNNLTSLPSTADGFQKMFVFNNKLWVKENNKPLQVLTGLKLKSINDRTFSANNFLGVPYETNDHSYFYSYPDFESYTLDSLGIISKTLNPHKIAMQLAIPYKAINTGNYIAFSTRKNGLMIVYPDGTNKFLNTQNGIISDIAAGISIDNQEAIWLALQNGLSRIEINTSWSNWSKENGFLDYVNNVIRHNNKVYVSTMTGVYYLKNNSWHKVAGLNSRVFTLLNVNDELYACAAEAGLYSIRSDSAKKVTNLDKIWTINLYNKNSLIVPAENSGLYQVNISDTDYSKKLLNSDLKGTPSSIYVANNDTTWIAMKWQGIYLIETKKDTAFIKKFDKKYGLPDINESEIIKVGNKILITTELGFYEINKYPKADSSDLFIPATFLPNHEAALNAAVDKDFNIWYSSYNSQNEQVLKKLAIQDDGSYRDESIPLRRLPNQIINHIYIDPEQDGVVWIAGTKGLFRYDERIPNNTKLPFNTRITKVESNDSTLFNGFYTSENENGAPSFLLDQPKSYRPSLLHKNNEIKFEFSSTSYTLQEKNEFSYYLEGLEKGWSKWTRGKQKEYSNLSPGTYTFHVKSRNLYETEGRATFYTFTIIPPWYLTNWAKVVFVLLGLVIIWIIVLLYSYRLRMHRKHLKLLVADRTFEVMAQKKEIEAQYKKLSEQTEEILLQSEQIELKNQDLEQQQEEILSINNQLEEMNIYLERKVEKRTAKIKSTLDKLKQTNKELDTFIYKASHDLKGPLSRILGLSSLAKIETPNEKNIQYLEMIERTSRDMDLLLSKLTQVHEIFNQKPKLVPLLIEDILEEVKLKLNYLQENNNNLISLNNQIHQPILADHQLFYTVIYNLIENALIYKNPDRENSHQVKVIISKTKHEIILEVKDNGQGIDENRIEAVFGMFYRASEQSKGSGLGLYLVKIAVEKMRGIVQVSSKLYESTTFTIKLPL